jgi:hypothetical protein
MTTLWGIHSIARTRLSPLLGLEGGRRRGEGPSHPAWARRYMSLDAHDVRHPLVNWRSRAMPTVVRLVNLAKDKTVWALAPTPQNLGG